MGLAEGDLDGLSVGTFVGYAVGSLLILGGMVPVMVGLEEIVGTLLVVGMLLIVGADDTVGLELVVGTELNVGTLLVEGSELTVGLVLVVGAEDSVGALLTVGSELTVGWVLRVGSVETLGAADTDGLSEPVIEGSLDMVGEDDGLAVGAELIDGARLAVNDGPVVIDGIDEGP